jgi:hypothetical protein
MCQSAAMISRRSRAVAAPTRRSVLRSGAWLLASPLLSQIAHAAPSPVDGILFYGQSNAGSGGPAIARRALPALSERSLSFASAAQTYGDRLIDPNALHGLAPLKDQPGKALLPAVAMAYALERSGAVGAPSFFHSVWYGSQPLSSFTPGSTCWNDLTAVADRMSSMLAETGRQSRVAAVVFIQGESGPSDRATYRRMLHELVVNGFRHLNGTAQPPLTMLIQTNASTVNPAFAVGVPLAQWDVARSLPDQVVLAGPAYQCPLSDGAHHSAEGRMMLGDLLALVYDIGVRRGGGFRPLQPREATRAGETITVAFDRPPESLDLQWDLDWVPPTPHYGFQVAGAAGPVAIGAVRISGPAEVTIKLDRAPPAGDLVVRYAMDRNVVPGWSPERGQLIAPTRRATAFGALGVKIPRTLSHYAIRFELTVR